MGLLCLLFLPFNYEQVNAFFNLGYCNKKTRIYVIILLFTNNILLEWLHLCRLFVASLDTPWKTSNAIGEVNYFIIIYSRKFILQKSKVSHKMYLCSSTIKFSLIFFFNFQAKLNRHFGDLDRTATLDSWQWHSTIFFNFPPFPIQTYVERMLG